MMLWNLTESWCILQFASQPLQLCGWREASLSHNNGSTSNQLSKQLTKTSITGRTGSYGGFNATTRTRPGILMRGKEIFLFNLMSSLWHKLFIKVAVELRCCWICWSLEWILNKLWMHQEFMYTMTQKVRPPFETPMRALPIHIYLQSITSINISVCSAAQWLVHLEEGVSREVAEELRKRGHKVNWPITGTE